MAPHENASGSPLLAAGLFIATALASQLLKHYLDGGDNPKNKDCDDDVISDIEDSEEERRKRRRLRQRVRRKREQKQQQKHRHDYNSKSKKIFRRVDDNEEEEDEGYQEDEDVAATDQLPNGHGVEFRDYYKLRRLEDRLSFENLRPLMQTPQNAQQPYSPSLQRNFNHTKKSPHSSSRRARRVGSAVDREDEYDFLPKNSNWNHFEKYNEDDVKNGLIDPEPACATATSYSDCHHFQPFSNGYNNQQYHRFENLVHLEEAIISTDGENATNQDVSLSESSSEEPQFVWTEAVHEKKANRNSPRHQAKVARVDAAAGAAVIAPLPVQAPTPLKSNTAEQQQQQQQVPTQERPRRLMTGDSTLTVPTSNKQERQFMNHVSIGLGASQEQQHGFPRQTPLERAPSSGVSSAYASSEISTSSDAAHPRTLQQAKHPKKNRGYSDDLVSSSHRSARAQYNAKIMPNKVVMIRHGQSMGNINEDLYSTTPDNAMPLTELGWEQARKAGQHLKSKVLAPSESVHFIVSPYARTVETFHGIVSAWCDPDSPEFASIPDREDRLKAWYGRLLEMGLTWHEDPRIREQDFGNYQDPELIRKAKKDRHRFGTFYYRFPHGESASDVFDRVSTFLDSLWRSFDMNRSRNYVLVTHGISIRVLLARYFRYTIHQFNILSNPRNCEMVVLNHDGLGRLRLQGRCQLHLKEKKKKEGEDNSSNSGDNATHKKENKVWETDEYRFYKKLRILPQAAIRKVDIRISNSDNLQRD